MLRWDLCPPETTHVSVYAFFFCEQTFAERMFVMEHEIIKGMLYGMYIQVPKCARFLSLGYAMNILASPFKVIYNLVSVKIW